MDDWFNTGRICDYCGVNIDTTDLEVLEFFHRECWKEYRKRGKTYPMPAHLG